MSSSRCGELFQLTFKGALTPQRQASAFSGQASNMTILYYITSSFCCEKNIHARKLPEMKTYKSMEIKYNINGNCTIMTAGLKGVLNILS